MARSVGRIRSSSCPRLSAFKSLPRKRKLPPVEEGLGRYNKKGIAHIRGAPNHPQTQGKIERWHQTLKNRVLLENCFLPSQLEAAVAGFVDHYNHHRYHESLANLTPADVYFGRGHALLAERETIKKLTIRDRRLSHHGQVA